MEIENHKPIRKTSERVFLENHPLVSFIGTPVGQILILDRYQLVSTSICNVKLIDRLMFEEDIVNRIFVIYPPNDSDVYWGGAYNPRTFEQSKYLRMAEVIITPHEWEYFMKPEIKREEKSNNKYKFLLLRR
jgi:hypothetical protein